jgi:hypothetical protein
MRSFVDNAGRTWTVQIHVTAIKRVRALLDGYDLYSLVDGKLEGLSSLLGDPILLVDVIYCLCKDEADKLGISDEDFGRGMAGASIERAKQAFVEEYVDFFPNSQIREQIREVLMLADRLMEKLANKAIQQVHEIDVDGLVETLSVSSGSAPELSASIRENSRSAS